MLNKENIIKKPLNFSNKSNAKEQLYLEMNPIDKSYKKEEKKEISTKCLSV